MSRLIVRLLLIVPLLLSGCMVRSLNPIYTEKDLVAMPALEGTWKGEGEGETLTFAKDGDAYRFTYGKDDKSLTADAHFAKVGKYTYLDLTLPDACCDQFDQTTKDALEGVMSFATPVHIFYQVDTANNVLRMRQMDATWAKERREKNRLWISHIAQGESTLLTADTPRVQRFLRRWENSKEAWGDWNELPLIPAESK